MAKAPAAPTQKPGGQQQQQQKSGGKGQPKKGAAEAPAVAKTRPKGTGEVPARLKDRFAQTVVAGLLNQ